MSLKAKAKAAVASARGAARDAKATAKAAAAGARGGVRGDKLGAAASGSSSSAPATVRAAFHGARAGFQVARADREINKHTVLGFNVGDLRSRAVALGKSISAKELRSSTYSSNDKLHYFAMSVLGDILAKLLVASTLVPDGGLTVCATREKETGECTVSNDVSFFIQLALGIMLLRVVAKEVSDHKKLETQKAKFLYGMTALVKHIVLAMSLAVEKPKTIHTLINALGLNVSASTESSPPMHSTNVPAAQFISLCLAVAYAGLTNAMNSVNSNKFERSKSAAYNAIAWSLLSMLPVLYSLYFLSQKQSA